MGSLIFASDNPSTFTNAKPVIKRDFDTYNRALLAWLNSHQMGRDFLAVPGNSNFPSDMTAWGGGANDPLLKYQQFYSTKMASSSSKASAEDLAAAKSEGVQQATHQIATAMGVKVVDKSLPPSQQGSPLVLQQQQGSPTERMEEIGASAAPPPTVDADLLAKMKYIAETAAQAETIREQHKQIQELLDQLRAQSEAMRALLTEDQAKQLTESVVDQKLAEMEAARAANSVGNATDALRLVMHASYERKDPGFDDQVKSVVSKTAFLQKVLDLRRMAEKSALPVAEGGQDVRFGPINAYTFLPIPAIYNKGFANSPEMKAFMTLQALLEKSNMKLEEVKKLVINQAENANKKHPDGTPIASVTKDMQAVLSRNLLGESLRYLYPDLAPEVYVWSYFSRRHLEKASGMKFKDESFKPHYLEMVRAVFPSLVNCLHSAAPTLSEKALSIFAENDAKDDSFISLTAFQLRALESELETASGKNCVVFFELMEAYTEFMQKNAAYQSALKAYFAASTSPEELSYVARMTKMTMSLDSLNIDSVAISSSMRGFLQGLKIAEYVYFCTDTSDQKIGNFKAVNEACKDLLESSTKFMSLLKTYAEKYHDKVVAILEASHVQRMDTVKILDSARVDKTPPVAKPDNGGFKAQMADVFEKSESEKELDAVDKSIKALNDKAEQGKKLLAVQSDVDIVLTAITDSSVEASLKAATSVTGGFAPYKSLDKTENLVKAKLPMPSFVQPFFASIDMKAFKAILEKNLVDLTGNYGGAKTLTASDILKCVESFARGDATCVVLPKTTQGHSSTDVW